MRRFAIVAIMLFQFASQTAIASTIYCEDAKLDVLSWVSKRLSTADIVFVGKVVAAKMSKPQPVAQSSDERTASSMKELLERIEANQRQDSTRFYQLATLQVERVWKGQNVPRLSVKNRVVPGQYGVPLKIDEEYLLFGYNNDDGEIVISTICAETLTVKQSTSRIAALNELTNVR